MPARDGGAETVAIRVFTVDARSGAPAAGVVLTVAADGQTLTTFVTDREGYGSVKLQRRLLGDAAKVTLRFGTGGRELAVDVGDLAKGLDALHVPLALDAEAIDARASGLPSVLEPDSRDALLSPASIGLVPRLSNGLCKQLMPTNMGVRRYGAFQVRADICNPQEILCPPRNATRFVNAKLLEYEIAWHPLGNSLGELLNTISLAPCEQVAVVVSDWMRQETASRQESSLVEEETTQQIDHDRMIIESLDSKVKTKSRSAGKSHQLGATIPLEKVNLTAVGNGGVAASTSTQQVAATTLNRLSDHITQAATFVQSRRSSVVFQATASERQRYQTRVVTNHNKCHTLTLMYYQVNRNYLVRMDYKGERDAILIEYPNVEFDARHAYCNAAVLRDALLDPSLDAAFDDLADALFCCGEIGTGTAGRMESVTIVANVAMSHNIDTITVTLLTVNGPVQFPPFSVLGWQAGTQSVTLTLPSPLDPASVMAVLLVTSRSMGIGMPMLVLNALTITYRATGIASPFDLFSQQSPIQLTHSWSSEVKAELPTGSEENPCVEKSCSVKKLLGHLNCHRLHYNSAVCLNEDPNERVARWSCCKGPDGDTSLVSLIENTPVATYGNFVVFAAAGSALVDDPNVLPTDRLVTLPTPGVYSEGILGQCDTCEIIDPKRFTDWKCSDMKATLPDVADPQAPTRPGDLKPETIANLITLSSVPSAPDSILKTLLETLLSSSKSGSSDATALLDKLFDLLKEGVKNAAAPAKS
jgi:hypothetical protein